MIDMFSGLPYRTCHTSQINLEDVITLDHMIMWQGLPRVVSCNLDWHEMTGDICAAIITNGHLYEKALTVEIPDSIPDLPNELTQAWNGLKNFEGFDDFSLGEISFLYGFLQSVEDYRNEDIPPSIILEWYRDKKHQVLSRLFALLFRMIIVGNQ